MMAAVICERRRSVPNMVRVLTLCLAFAGGVLMHAPQAEAELKHQYSFNTAAAAGGTFQDLQGNADGTLFGTATVSGGNTGQLILPGGGTGESGNHAGLLANGTDGININTYTNASFSLWATWNGAGDWQRYFDFGGHSVSSPTFGGNTVFMTANAGGADGVRFAISNIDLNTQAGFNNEQSISWNQTQTAGQERHIVGVFDGANDQMRLYVNGVQVAQNIAPITHMLSLLQTDSAFLGAALYPDANFVGSINQFEVYDNALTPAEVTNLYVAGKIGEPQTPIPQLTVNRDTGIMTLANTIAPVQILGYSITSTAGSLNSASWQTIAANFDATSGGEVDTDDEWTVLSAAGSKTDFSEFTFDNTPGNGGLLGPSFSPQLGNAGAWRKSIYEDLAVQLKLANGTTLDAVVNYTGNGGVSFRRSDLNFDSAINGADWLLFRTNNLVDLSTMTLVEAYAKGDLNGDRDNDFDDFLMFKADYDAFNGAGAFQLMVASVPEPASLFTLAVGSLFLCTQHRRRSSRSLHSMNCSLTTNLSSAVQRGALFLIAAAASLLLASAPAHAVLTHQYTFNGNTPNDSVGTAHGTLIDGTLAGAPAVTGGSLRLNNPGFSGPSTAANYLSLPVSILPTSGSVTIEQWFTFTGSGFFTEAWAFSDRNGGANPPGANAGQYFMHTISNPQGGPNSAGGGSSVAQTTAGFAAGSESRAFGTTVGIGAGGGGYLDDGQSYYAATVLDSTAGTLNYYVYRLSDGVGGLQSSIPAIPLSSYAFNEAFIGRSPFDVDNATSGSVDEFRISNNALTAQQVADSFYFGPAPSDGITIEVNKGTGAVTMKNNSASALSIDHYSIISRGGALNNSWSGLGSLDSQGAGEGQSWSKAGGADANELAELFLAGSSTFDPNESHALGTAYNPATFGAANGDLVMQYHLTTGERLYGQVTYVSGPAAVSGDYNQNGVVDAADYTVWRNRLGQNSPLPNTNPADVDGTVTQAEYNYWKTRFGATSGSGGGAVSPAAVPEPATWLLATCTLGGAILAKGRRRSSNSLIQGSETMISNPRGVARSILALLLLVTITTTAAASRKDRFYQFGDDTTEQPAVGQPPTTEFGALTGDSVAIGPNDFSDLSYGSGPVYVNTNTLVPSRPGSAVGEWGLTFDGTSNSLIRVNGSLGSPAVGDDDAVYAGNPNFTDITTRLMEGWVRPTNAALGRQDVVNDSTQFGIFISADDKWGFTHGGTAITSATSVAPNAWTHVMHRTFTNTAGVLLVDGVAVAATPNDYNVGFNPATAEKNLVFGANTDQTANFFAGQLDNFSFYVSGNNSGVTNGANWGAVDLATENDYIRQRLIGKPNGDVNLDGAFNPADVTAFVANWLSTKQVNGVTVGDITTRGKGDFDFNGVVNLDDAFTLHQALIGAGAGGLDFTLLGANVPEPGSLLLVAIGGIALVSGARTRRTVPA